MYSPEITLSGIERIRLLLTLKFFVFIFLIESIYFSFSAFNLAMLTSLVSLCSLFTHPQKIIIDAQMMTHVKNIRFLTITPKEQLFSFS